MNINLTNFTKPQPDDWSLAPSRSRVDQPDLNTQLPDLMNGWRLMLPQSSKKGISILRQTTLYRPISFTCVLFVPNYLNTSFVNKLDYLPFFEKQNFNTCTAWLSIKTLCVNQLLITTDEFIQNFEIKILVKPLTLSPTNASCTNLTTTEFGEQLYLKSCKLDSKFSDQ